MPVREETKVMSVVAVGRSYFVIALHFFKSQKFRSKHWFLRVNYLGLERRWSMYFVP